MLLSVRDVAEILKVSENTVHQWIVARALPASQVNGECRFNKLQLLDWATENQIEIPALAFRTSSTASPRLDVALEHGGIIRNVSGGDKATILRAILPKLPLSEEDDRQALLSMFLARESLGSTSIGDGIALPHPKQPIVQPNAVPAISLCFLGQPVDWAAANRQPVSALFVLLCPTVRVHLHLVSRLVSALRDPMFRDLVRRQAADDEILSHAKKMETTAAPTGNGHPETV
jgi:PTS system nitrogen regulatory IIA component